MSKTILFVGDSCKIIPLCSSLHQLFSKNVPGSKIEVGFLLPMKPVFAIKMEFQSNTDIHIQYLYDVDLEQEMEEATITLGVFDEMVNPKHIETFFSKIKSSRENQTIKIVKSSLLGSGSRDINYWAKSETDPTKARLTTIICDYLVEYSSNGDNFFISSDIVEIYNLVVTTFSETPVWSELGTEMIEVAAFLMYQQHPYESCREHLMEKYQILCHDYRKSVDPYHYPKRKPRNEELTIKELHWLVAEMEKLQEIGKEKKTNETLHHKVSCEKENQQNDANVPMTTGEQLVIDTHDLEDQQTVRMEEDLDLPELEDKPPETIQSIPIQQMVAEEITVSNELPVVESKTVETNTQNNPPKKQQLTNLQIKISLDSESEWLDLDTTFGDFVFNTITYSLDSEGISSSLALTDDELKVPIVPPKIFLQEIRKNVVGLSAYYKLLHDCNKYQESTRQICLEIERQTKEFHAKNMEFTALLLKKQVLESQISEYS